MSGSFHLIWAFVDMVQPYFRIFVIIFPFEDGLILYLVTLEFTLCKDDFSKMIKNLSAGSG
jgi:hypothetical protein